MLEKQPKVAGKPQLGQNSSSTPSYIRRASAPAQDLHYRRVVILWLAIRVRNYWRCANWETSEAFGVKPHWGVELPWRPVANNHTYSRRMRLRNECNCWEATPLTRCSKCSSLKLSGCLVSCIKPCTEKQTYTCTRMQQVAATALGAFMSHGTESLLFPFLSLTYKATGCVMTSLLKKSW